MRYFRKTSRISCHVFLKLKEKYNYSTSLVEKGIDIREEGIYIITIYYILYSSVKAILCWKSLDK